MKLYDDTFYITVMSLFMWIFYYVCLSFKLSPGLIIATMTLKLTNVSILPAIKHKTLCPEPSYLFFLGLG